MPCLKIVNKKEVKEEFIKEVTSNVQNTQLGEVEDTNETWNKFQKRSKSSSWKNDRKRRKATKK
jgi:hypothetical protein